MPKLETSGRALAAIGFAGFALFAPISIAAMQIALGVAASGIFLAWLGGWRPERTPLDLALALFVAAALASTIFSREGPGSPEGFTLWRHAAGFWICWQAIGLARDPSRTARRGLLLAAAGVAIASMVGLIQYKTGTDVVHALGLRATARLVEAPGVPGRFAPMGFFISRLTFGHNAMILVSLFAGAIFFAGFSKTDRAALALSSAIALLAIVLTFDRAAWLGLFAAALTLLAAAGARLRSSLFAGAAAKRAPRARSRALLFAGLGCIAVCAAAAAVPAVRARFSSGFSVEQNSDRVFIWARAMEIIRDHPLAGIGFGNYPRVCQRYYNRVDASFPMRTWAHNSFLSLWAEMGPLGLLASVFLVVQIARALWRRFREGGPFSAGAMAAALGLLVVAQAHDVVYDSKVMYPFWFALSVGLQPKLNRPPPSTLV